MEVIDGSTRQVFLYDDVVHKHPRVESFDKGIEANNIEIDNGCRFPQYCAKVTDRIGGIINVQERLLPLQMHPSLKSSYEIFRKFFEIPIGQRNDYLSRFPDLDTEFLHSLIGGRLPSYYFHKAGIMEKVRKVGGTAFHEIHKTDSFGIDNQGRILIIDGGDKNLGKLLTEMGDEIFDVLNTSIRSGN